jgi:hypothetical protein
VKTLKLQTDEAMPFDSAQALARRQAEKHLTSPMMLSWLNSVTGRHSPNVECCQEDGKEAWEIYAESRGGTLRVEIDDKFVFIFREGFDSISG